MLAMFNTACLSPACVAGNPVSKDMVFFPSEIVKQFLEGCHTKVEMSASGTKGSREFCWGLHKR